jgi:hypothetical protein
MAAEGLVQPWFEARPELAEEIARELREYYPTLRLELGDGKAEVLGTFPILDEDGVELDRWQVSIELPEGYPNELPVVRETGGRLVPTRDNHVLPSDGTACVLLPETRYRWFPRGATFQQYLEGPMRSYFANQSYRARGGSWTHDEWAHGARAAVDFYKDLLGSKEDIVGWRGLIAMGLRIRGDQACPCGRRWSVSKCHPVLIDVQSNLSGNTVLRRMVNALEEKLSIKGEEMVISFLRALRHDVKGHHDCPCGSGRRIRDCHPTIRELNGAMPVELQRNRRGKRRKG